MTLSGKLVGGYLYSGIHSGILNFYRSFPSHPIARLVHQTPSVRSPVYIFPFPQNKLYL